MSNETPDSNPAKEANKEFEDSARSFLEKLWSPESDALLENPPKSLRELALRFERDAKGRVPSAAYTFLRRCHALEKELQKAKDANAALSAENAKLRRELAIRSE